MAEDSSVTLFREYLRINTMHPDPDYGPCVKFLCRVAEELGLQCKTVEPHPGKPFVIMTWIGQDPSLPSLHLYSHTDVVPVFPEKWTYEPFSAHKDENGDIYARGTQDMKCVGIQYVEAIRRMKAAGITCKRTVHITWGPDEEVSGALGMKKFVETQDFRDLNIGFALDEGIASPNDVYKVFYAERCIWWLKVSCYGNPGHGSKFIQNTAAEKFRKITTRFLDFRAEQRKKLEGDPKLTIGDVITVNMTKVEGGVQLNVVPAELFAYFDIRVPPTIDHKKFIAEMESWCKAVGEGVEMEFVQHYWIDTMASTNKNDPWFGAFSGVMDSLNMKYTTEIFTGGTDARYLRDKKYPALGFSPIINTPQLLHDNDEFLNENIFLDGIGVYEKLIPALANVPPV